MSSSDPFGRVLQRLHEERQRHFGAGHVSLEPLKQDRRRFSDVLRVRVQAGGREFHIFVKVLKSRGRPGVNHPNEADVLRERVVAEFSTAERVRSHFGGHAGFATLRPIACYPEFAAIVTEEARGETFLQVLEGFGAWMPDADAQDRLCRIARRLGGWLRVFQKIERRDSKVSLDDMRQYVDVRLQQLTSSRHAGFSEEQRGAVLRFFDTRCQRAAEADLQEVPLHADLAPSNVIVDGTTIAVIDFDRIKSGAVHHDLAHVFMQIELLALKPQFSRAVVERIQTALLEGFDGALDRSRAMFQLLLLQHVLCHWATLCVRRGEGMERLYNRYVRRRHRQWLNALLESSPDPVGAGVLVR